MVGGEAGAAHARRMRGKPVAALMMLAVALNMATQIDAFAKFVAVLWLASFLVVCASFAVALRGWRATRK